MFELEAMLRLLGGFSRLPRWHLGTAPRLHRDHGNLLEPTFARLLRGRCRLSGPVGDGERRRLVASMTNWQRSCWARAGYPPSLRRMREFAALRYSSRRVSR